MAHLAMFYHATEPVALRLLLYVLVLVANAGRVERAQPGHAVGGGRLVEPERRTGNVRQIRLEQPVKLRRKLGGTEGGRTQWIYSRGEVTVCADRLGE
jgi:hypothetical protein